MTVVGNSILVEIVTVAEHQERLLNALHAAAPQLVRDFGSGAGTSGCEGVAALLGLIESLRIEIKDFTVEHANRAVAVYAQFGKVFIPPS